MRKIIGYNLIVITIILYVLWIFTDIIKGDLLNQILPVIMIFSPIVGVKLIRKKKRNEKNKNIKNAKG